MAPSVLVPNSRLAGLFSALSLAKKKRGEQPNYLVLFNAVFTRAALIDCSCKPLIWNDSVMTCGADRAKRESVFLTAQLTCGAEDFGTVRVKNISQTGMLIRCTAGLVKGRRVALKLRGAGTAQGTVVRVGATTVGINFETAIEPALVRRSVGDGPDPLPEYLRVPPALPRLRK